MHRKSKAQSAVEFVSTYAFVFLIIAIILFLLFMFASVPTKILPFQCTAFSGFSCVDVLYTTAGNSLLQISLTDTQAGVVSIGSFGAKINNVAAMDGTCTRGAVLPGNTVTCTVSFPFAAALGGIYTGVFNVSANYCTNGVGNISNTTCQAGNSFTYAGSFTVQVQKPSLPLFVGGFNGVSSYVDAGNQVSLAIPNAITLVVWVNPNSPPAIGYGHQSFVDKPSIGGDYSLYRYDDGSVTTIVFRIQGLNNVNFPNTGSTGLAVGTWYQIVGTYDGSRMSIYKNGVPMSNVIVTGPIPISTSHLEIGGNSNFNGLISNVQVYSIALTPAQIKNLYAEGIGGAPINTANNVGWWPLNNNANDVSGTGNNGVATNLVYNSLWISGYTAP